jgi:hypothetical protein
LLASFFVYGVGCKSESTRYLDLTCAFGGLVRAVSGGLGVLPGRQSKVLPLACLAPRESAATPREGHLQWSVPVCQTRKRLKKSHESDEAVSSINQHRPLGAPSRGGAVLPFGAEQAGGKTSL